MNQLRITDVVVRRDKKFLVVTNRKFPDKFTCPGGKIEPDETPAECARRELEEEVGIKVPTWGLEFIGVFAFRWYDQRMKCFSFELKERAWKDQEPWAVEPNTQIYWVDRDDLLDVGGKCLSPAFYGWLMATKGW